MSIEHLPTREGYDRWASIYDSDGNPLTALEEPHVDRLLGDARGLKIADVGSGTGRHAIRLAMRGAEVTALDFSEEMLNKARVKAAQVANNSHGDDATPWPWCGVQGGGRVRFKQHDLAHDLPLENQSFDRVLCSLVLEHIRDLEFVFAQMKRICSAKGWIIVSNLHPAMMLRGVTARFTDPITRRETRPASCTHQVTDYVNAAIRAGLIIDHLSEHAVDAALAQRLPRAERYLGWPMLFMMRLRP